MRSTIAAFAAAFALGISALAGVAQARPMVPPPEPGEEEPDRSGQCVELFIGGRFQEVENPDPQPPFYEDLQLTDMTFGLEWDYRGSDDLGVAAFVQFTGGDTDARLFGLGFNMYSSRGAFFQLGTVFEQRDGDDTTALRAEINWRGYTGKKDRGTVTPSLAIDFSDDVMVIFFGLSIGRRF